jgi:hypothetical protein
MRKSMHDFCSRKVSGYSVPGTGQERVGTELRTFMPQAMMEVMVMMMTASEWGEGPGHLEERSRDTGEARSTTTYLFSMPWICLEGARAVPAARHIG